MAGPNRTPSRDTIKGRRLTLPPGTRLGPYEIISPAGAGGMGEVYRARDTRLERDVAIKVLPERLSHNPELRARFEREARAVSSLNHPHICTLHDVGHQEGIAYLVMEYLQGESLAARLARGPLPPDELLVVATQIAEALNTAHRHGLIHRDLKPGNIMLTPSGAKVLDFGLAKITAGPAPAADGTAGLSLTVAPTARSPVAAADGSHAPLTAAGTILGTFEYMAPEQIEGKEADARSDIFAFGATLYEMATGERAFGGRTQASLIASILKDEPRPISGSRSPAPGGLDGIVRNCLAKNPDERRQTMHDVLLDLRALAAGVEPPSSTHADPARRGAVPDRGRSPRLAWAAAALCAAAAAGAGVAWWQNRPAPNAPAFVIRSSIETSGSMRFRFDGVNAGAVTLSPDGRFLTFSATGPDGIRRLWLRGLDALEAGSIPESENGQYPFWSPDSRFIAFFAGGKLKKVATTGGQVVTLCNAPDARGGTWGSTGVILFTPHWRRQPIYRVSAEGGDPVAMTRLDAGRNETTHRWPSFLPDGRHFVFLAGSHIAESTSGDNAIYLGSLDSDERKLLIRARSSAVFASGHLLFSRGGSLMARPFDPVRLEFTGEERTLATGVQYEGSYFQGVFGVSSTGLLAYHLGGTQMVSDLVWMDRGGRVTGKVLDPANFYHVKLSHDGKRLAVCLDDPADVWLVDLQRQSRTRLTFAPMGEWVVSWSPDDRSVSYVSDETNEFTSWSKRTDGSGERVPLAAAGGSNTVTDFSPDGRVVISTHAATFDGASDLWVIPVAGEGEAAPFFETPFSEIDGVFSPDGRWLAYASDRSGRPEVYVRSFPDAGRMRQVSIDGGIAPRWAGGARELFFIAPDRALMAVRLAFSPELSIGTPRPLFDSRVRIDDTAYYDVAADGERFLVNRLPADSGAASITLVNGWTLGSTAQ